MTTLEDFLPENWQPQDARSITVTVLAGSDHEFPSVALNALLDRTDFPLQERRLATELVCGMIRRSATLDAIIGAHLSRPIESIEPGLHLLLKLGTYQLVFLDSIPPHAAVHETIELAKRLGKPRWAGFMNGVLRSIDRTLLTEIVESPSADAIPIKPGVFRKCQKSVFPSIKEKRIEHLAAAFSFPQWLLERWSDRWPGNELAALIGWFNSPAPFHLRVNSLKTDRDAYLDMLRGAGIEASPGEVDVCVRLASNMRVNDLPGFNEGLATVQDETAMHAAMLLQPQPGQTVLDLCAAPGTKTTHLAELMQNEGRIIATDVNEDRLESIHQSAERLGLSIIETQPIDRDGTNIPDGPFDSILIDAPCSNTGVLGKRPEARWRLTESDLTELSEIQRSLIREGASRLKPGGRLVYSTCSIDVEENEAVAQSAIDCGLQIESIQAFLPGSPSDGGFLAVMTK